MKDSHSLLKVYFVLLPVEGNYLVLLLTDSKQFLGFLFGSYPLSLKIKHPQLAKLRGKNDGWMLRRA